MKNVLLAAVGALLVSCADYPGRPNHEAASSAKTLTCVKNCHYVEVIETVPVEEAR